MENRFTITITDKKGIRQYNIHKIIKKIAIYLFILLCFFISIGILIIFYLNIKLEILNKKIFNSEKSFNILKEQNDNFKLDINKNNKLLEVKKRELEEISDKLGDIEDLIGLNPDVKSVDINERIDIAELSSLQVSFFFRMIPNSWPIPRNTVTSKFGYRMHPTLKRKEFHRGIDIRARMKTPVYATADGLVEYAGYHKASGFGNLVIVQHFLGFKTTFAHLNKVLVGSGEFVKKGQVIALTGNSGLSSGPHLHYEVRFIQRALEPLNFLNLTIKNYRKIMKKERRVQWQSLVKAINYQIVMLRPQ